MAGFEVIIYGRFWVITEGNNDQRKISYRFCFALLPGEAGGDFLTFEFDDFFFTGASAFRGVFAGT